MRITRWGGGVALGLAAGALALAGPAAAHHAAPELTAGEPGDCGELTIATGQWPEDTHQVASTVLVVQAGGEQHTAAVGEAITVGPFDAAETTVRWRVWGGGERDYDDPPLADLDALVAYLEQHPGGELDADPPGVAWHELVVQGCPKPEPTPTPTTEPTAEPTTEPTGEPSPDPSTPPAGGTGGEKPGLPVTGSSLPVLGGLGAALLAGGSGLWWLARRRQGVSFTS